MTGFWPITCLFLVFLQAAGTPPPSGEIFNAKEKARFEKADKVDGRIKVYTDASKRIQQTLEDAINKDDFQAFPDNLKLWTSLLSKSLEDIETNLKSKKKSKNLIRFEIQVRKAISNSLNYKIKSPVELHDAFDACLEKAEKIRQQFVEILFDTKKQ